MISVCITIMHRVCCSYYLVMVQSEQRVTANSAITVGNGDGQPSYFYWQQEI